MSTVAASSQLAAPTPRAHPWRPRRRSAASGGTRPLWARVAAALPAGTVPARGQRPWLSVVDDALDADPLRADAADNVRAVAKVLAWHASWRAPMLTRPTWELLADRTGLSRRTVCNHLRWLRDHQLLAVWQTGRTAAFAPMALTGMQANQAGEYLLLAPAPAGSPPAPVLEPVSGPPATNPEPDSPTSDAAPSGSGRSAVDRTCPPTWSRRDPEGNPHAREPHRPQGRWRAPGKPSQDRETRPDRTPDRRRDRGRAARLELAERLRAHAPPLRALTIRRVASLIRGHTDAGWEYRDFTWALDHHPDDRAHWHTHPVHSPAGWLRHRLDLWRDETGEPLFSRTRVAQSARWREKARTAHDTRTPPVRATPGAGPAAARAALRDAAARRSHDAGPEPATRRPGPDTGGWV